MSGSRNIFQAVKPYIIGMIHVKALPVHTQNSKKHVAYNFPVSLGRFNLEATSLNRGAKFLRSKNCTPRNNSNLNSIISQAWKEAEIYKSCNVDSVLIENMHDVPYVQKEFLGPEITACMTRICTEIRRILPLNMACGVQILAGGNKEAIAVAQAANLQYIRAEGFIFSHIADEGFMNSCAGQLLRYRKYLGADNISIFTDIKKKHCSHSITNDVTLEETAKAAEFFLSDGIVLTGKATGEPTDVEDLQVVKNNCSLPVIIGSGVTADNIEDYMNADAIIVGSYFKKNGDWRNEVDKERVSKFMTILEAKKQSQQQQN